MRTLLDTCVLSELRHPKGHRRVRQVVEAFDGEDLFVSVVSIGEITKGIELLKEGRRKHELQGWLQTIEREYADRVLSIDFETGRIWGKLAAATQKAGRPMAASDGLIAATARRHGLHLMTRNVGDFAPAGVLLINPWDDAE